MRNIILVACGLVLVAGVNGCGSSAEKLMKEQIKLMDEFSEALEKGAEPSKLEEVGKRMRENVMKYEGLNLSDEKKKKLGEKYAAEVSKASTRLNAAMKKNMDKLTSLQLDTIFRTGVATSGK
jgi:hypothetical protein